MKKDKMKELFLEQVRKIPIILLACDKLRIGRTTVYSWKAKDKDFKKKLEDALSEGEENINEMSEVQLVSMIKEKNWQAVSFWLRHRHPKFKDKIEIDTTIRTQNNELTPEQDEAVKRALKFAGLIEGSAEPENNKNIINNNQNNGNSKQQSTTGTESGDGENATDSTGKQ